MASLAIKGVTKSFGRTPALIGIDLTVLEGEFCVIAGPSGCGKSTLLRAIAGLEKVDGGSIEIDGELVNDWQPRERDVAMVFQSDALFPAMSLYDNIAFSLKARRVSPAEIEPRVRRVAELLGLADLLGRPTRKVSEAVRRRAAIGRAVVRDARLCLLDEPLANANAALRDEMREEIQRLHREFPTTKVYATHDPIEAMTLAERTVVMREGRVEQEGAPIDLFERPLTRFVAGFFGWPKMNFLAGRLARGDEGDAIHLDDRGINIALPPNRLPKETGDGLPVILGLRPEHMIRAVRASPSDGMYRYEAEVELLQPMGSRTYVTFRMGGERVVAELHAHDVSRPGDRVPIDVNLKRASVFDATTGRAL